MASKVIFVIDPCLQFRYPVVQRAPHYQHRCPVFYVLSWQCPVILPTALYDFINQFEKEIDLDFSIQTAELEQFILHFYNPINPYKETAHMPFLSITPPLIPTIPVTGPPSQK